MSCYLQHTVHEAQFLHDQSELLEEIAALPATSALRQLDIMKQRTQQLKACCCLLEHLRSQVQIIITLDRLACQSDYHYSW